MLTTWFEITSDSIFFNQNLSWMEEKLTEENLWILLKESIKPTWNIVWYGCSIAIFFTREIKANYKRVHLYSKQSQNKSQEKWTF